MSGKYFVGLDSGGTKTEVAVLAADGSYVTGCFSGPIPMHFVEIPENSIKLVRGALESALLPLKLSFADVAHFGFGMSGIDFDDDIPTQRRTLFSGLGIDPAHASLVNDGVVALWGGTPKKKAVILQLGTAFTAAYRTKIGDEQPFDQLNAGVILEIRRAILTLTYRAWDGRLKIKTKLPELIQQHFEIERDQLIKLGVQGRLDRWKLLTVIDPWRQAVEQGDRLALKILEEAAKVFSQDILFLLDKTGSGTDVVLGGGLLRHGPQRFRDRLAELVRRKHPQATIHMPHLSPAIGAALMSAFHEGANYPAVFKQARKTWTPVVL